MPPAVFLAGWLAGWILNRYLEFSIDGAGPGAIQIAIGVLFTIAGVGLFLGAGAAMQRAGTTMLQHRAASKLVMSGPFRFTRNPIYLGFTSVYLGASALANAAWPLVLLPVVLITLTAVVVYREESHLRAAFADEYVEYCRRVPRWL